MKRTIYLLLAVMFTAIVFNSCSDSDDNVTYKDVSVNFASSDIGLGENTSSVNVAVNLSRNYGSDVTVTINMSSDDLVYDTDYTTDATVSEKTLTVTVPAGSTSASFKITKKDGALFNGTETLKLEITSLSSTSGILIGDKKIATITFGAILSSGETLTLEGKVGDVVYANMVYVNFATNTQTPVDRKSWNLGFYCGNDFRVFLNSSLQMATAATSKTNINDVTIADIEGLPTLVPVMMESKLIDTKNVDDLAGEITKTAFDEISANDDDNKVYILAMEGHTTAENYYKIKVSRNASGYKVQYGLLGETTINTVEIAKDNSYNMVGLSFDTKQTVVAEPKSKNWDIMWAYGTGGTTTNGQTVVYFMQDIVLSNNLSGVQVAEVMTDEFEYNNFTASDISKITFNTARNTIGTNWRVVAKMNGSTEAIGIRTNRFYVVKDANANYYKLKFNQMGLANDGGERGRPVIEYALVK